MAFRFEWMDDQKRAMVYIVEGDWNWKDYHHAVRASTFSMHGIDHSIESIIDLRGSTRPTLPSGLLGHVRSFGRKNHPMLTGRAIVIGMPDEGLQTLQPRDDMILPTTDGFVLFVSSQDVLEQTLSDWLENPPTTN